MESDMKKIIISQLFIAFLLFSGLTAQTKLNDVEVKSALTKIFNLSKDQNFAETAKLLLFNDKDEFRSYNYKDPSEAKSVKRLVKKIKAYLDLSDSYEYESLSNSNMGKFQSADLKVNFKSGDQELTISFKFVKIGEIILLSEFR
jgi:hypothetical protein